jgi:hypothetical protein
MYVNRHIFIHTYIRIQGDGHLKPDGIALEKAQWMVKNFLRDQGDRVRGDYNFSDDYISQILSNGLDMARGEVRYIYVYIYSFPCKENVYVCIHITMFTITTVIIEISTYIK